MKWRINIFLSCIICFAVSAVHGAKPLSDDEYEPNDTLNEAYASLPSGIWLSEHDGLGIHNDDDWYRVELADSDKLRILVECKHTAADGDIDFEIYDSYNSEPLQQVWTAEDYETLDYTALQTGIYYIKVLSRDGTADGNSYDLRWKALPTVDDAYEPNDTIAEAFTGLAEGVWLSSIDGSGFQRDDDWYRVELSDPEKLRLVVDCTFLQSEGDIDLVLYDANGIQLDYPWSSSDNEQIDYIVPAIGYYYVKVCFGNAGNAYDLRWITLAGTPPSLTHITIDGPDSVNENSTAAYTCTAHYSDNSTKNVTTSTQWGENSSYTTISSEGILTTLSVLIDQAVTVSASFGGMNAAKSVTIMDVQLVLSDLTISGSAEIISGSSTQYVCTAHYSDGTSADVTSQSSWSENSSVAAITGEGYLTASEVTSDTLITITASFSGLTAEKDVVIRSAVESVAYSDWVLGQNITDSMYAHEDQPAGDGIPNLLKYACQLPAMEYCSTTNLMTVVIDRSSESYAIRYRVWKSAVEAEVVPLFAFSLEGPWYPVEINTKIGEDDAMEYWQATIPLMDKGFMRLQAVSVGGGVM